MQKFAADGSSFKTPISETGAKAVDATTEAVQKGTRHVGDFFKTKGGRNIALGALGVGGVAAGTLWGQKKLQDAKQGYRQRRMQELSGGY